MYVSLLIPVLLSKTPEELTSMTSRKFEYTDCWQNSFDLSALKVEESTRPSNRKFAF